LFGVKQNTENLVEEIGKMLSREGRTSDLGLWVSMNLEGMLQSWKGGGAREMTGNPS
jgi:hypothetical protein